MSNTVEIIDSATRSVETFSGLGQNGFMVFAIAIVAFMFLFMGVIAWKSLSKIMSNHNNNEARIDEAHERIHYLEERENKCIERISKVTDELESCVRAMKNKG